MFAPHISLSLSLSVSCTLIAFVYYYYYYYYLHTHFLNGPSISLLNVTQISLTLEKVVIHQLIYTYTSV